MLEILQDPTSDALDELAALGENWMRNRKSGRMSNGIRQAMLLVAHEALLYDAAAKRDERQHIICLCPDYIIIRPPNV